MRQIDLISSEWLDILFEDRNKEYGAYVIRQDTGKRNLWAIISLGVVLALGIGVYYGTHAYASYKKAHPTYDEVITLIDLGKKDEPKVEKKVTVEEPERIVDMAKCSIKFVAPRIVKDDEANPEDMLRSQDEVMHSTVAIGALEVTNGSDNGEVLKIKDAIAQPEPKHEEIEEKVIDFAEQMPAFPGGNGELMAFLGKNIKYPVICQEQGIQGRVFCSFVVEKDGSITDVRVLRSVDPNLDREAVRVIKLMPKWIPGRQNGRPVRVKFNVPVTFRLQ